ncbi:hypothetical protein [Polaromonas sp. CG9_12]|nr:hypothetical protein [Polaromonas sp. CG9_12]
MTPADGVILRAQHQQAVSDNDAIHGERAGNANMTLFCVF